MCIRDRLSVWNFSKALAIISAFVVILTAGYILWAIQRVYLGAEYKGPHEEDIVPITIRELFVAVPLFVLAIIFGIFPNLILQFMDKTVTNQVQLMAEWTDEHAPTPVVAPVDAAAPAAAQNLAPQPIEAAATPNANEQVFMPVSNLSCLLYTSPSPRDATLSRMPSSA